ncbi:MAG: hypothetical protein NTW21_44265 [Verrucomicrobia bacterium]|nr:hypothetical protein [Verrucomicrobiota bacterium]
MPSAPASTSPLAAWPHSGSATGITHKVLTSENLVGWTDVTAAAVDAGGFLTCTLPVTLKLFVRLEVLVP